MNRTYDQIQVGDTAALKRLCTADDFFVFANSSGNQNPMHLLSSGSKDSARNEPVAPSMWVGSLISSVLGNILPGPGTLYRSQFLEFKDRAHAGEELLITVTVTDKGPDRRVSFATKVERTSDQAEIVSGEAVVFAPDTPMDKSAEPLPELLVQRHRHYDRLIEAARPLDAIPTAVVAPEETQSLGGALLAADETIISPILIGNRALIEMAADELGRSLDGIELIDCDSHPEAARRAVALVNDGRAGAVMKGHLHTDELLGAVVLREGGLRTGRRLSHVFVMDVPGHDQPLLISDAAINIQPDLEVKVDIVQNAIDLAHALGMDEPRVGVLSAVETVNPKIPSSVDAALLSKMAERGQIRGGVVDGPLAMDNAIDLGAARTKGIKSLVAGNAEILVVPNLDAGNMVAKQLTYVSHAEGAGIVLGAKVPVILTSRADGRKSRLASCAVAALYHAHHSGRSQV